MPDNSTIEITKLVVSILGFGGTITALAFGFRQYARAEKWKRSEFVAKEIKEFESDATVRNALQMIDWGERRINLFLVQNPTDADYIKITREDQWRALLPHRLKPEYPSLSVLQKGSKELHDCEIRFTPVEAKIRDTYDSFLGYFERFANFIKSDLVTANEFKSYIGYWIDSIAAGDSANDDAWRCALLTYINYYNYSGVKYLFKSYDLNIEPNGKIFTELKENMNDKLLCEKLLSSIASKRTTHKAQISST
jgi:hypothetical protein